MIGLGCGKAWFWLAKACFQLVKPGLGWVWWLFVWFWVDLGVSNPDFGEPKPGFHLLDPACGLDFGVPNPDFSS